MSKKHIAVIIALALALLGALAVPSFLKARETAQLNACIGQMCVIESAKEAYAAEHDLPNGDILPLEGLLEYMGPFIRDGGWDGFHCPSATSNTYTIGRFGEDPGCFIHGSRSEARARATGRGAGSRRYRREGIRYGQGSNGLLRDLLWRVYVEGKDRM